MADQYANILWTWQTWRRQWKPTPILLPGKSYGRRSLVGCSPWYRKESDTTEWLDFHFSLSCIGEGNSTPLQCSCLENPRDGTAEPGRLPSMGLHRVGHDWRDLAAAAAAAAKTKQAAPFTHWAPSIQVFSLVLEYIDIYESYFCAWREDSSFLEF